MMEVAATFSADRQRSGEVDAPAIGGDGFILRACELSRVFGEYAALDQINLDIREGEFVALLGPSGCGKTTLLKIIAGLMTPTGGRLLIGDRDVAHIPAHRRPVNTVFQNYALFPHLSVYDNVAFGLRRARCAEAKISDEVSASLRLVGLEGMSDRYPAQLSGGQQQRVALARAVVNKPAVLLLDEPLSALDLQLRKRMQLELKDLQRLLGMTFIFVTHDQDEALTMADRIVVMNKGCIEQVGTGEQIYSNPRTRFVAEFIGEANFISLADEKIVGCPAGWETGVLMIRPEQISISQATPDGESWQSIHAEVRQVIFKGPFMSVLCLTDRGTEVAAVGAAGMPPPPAGTKVCLSWRADVARQFGG